MRWNAFAATLPADNYSRLVNLVTAGRGYVYIAAHLARANAEARAILEQVDQALRSFAAVTDLLQQFGQVVHSADRPPAETPAAPALQWQEFLRTRTPTDAAQLTTALADAFDHAAGVAVAMNENGEVAAMARRLAASVECLQLIRYLCQLILSL